MKLGLTTLIAALTLVACVQYPTERQSVVDTRPSLSFRMTGTSDASTRVIVDGLDMGSVSDYLEGKGSLRILPGTHVIKITNGTSLLLQETLYVGDGVNRTMTVK